MYNPSESLVWSLYKGTSVSDTIVLTHSLIHIQLELWSLGATDNTLVLTINTTHSKL